MPKRQSRQPTIRTSNGELGKVFTKAPAWHFQVWSAEPGAIMDAGELDFDIEGLTHDDPEWIAAVLVAMGYKAAATFFDAEWLGARAAFFACCKANPASGPGFKASRSLFLSEMARLRALDPELQERRRIATHRFWSRLYGFRMLDRLCGGA